ncbi:GNAT family N-acetyltransferase [Brevibacillus borstelensis]|uniref:GNAT family N-acetyltransferase n=1 Tax=Brevibacillus borstelensis TaxID=45462 RepID=UPI0020416A21|nr:N-acetyltransferase [Brevibacillus borstelensis]MCM3623272.1 GNAT family N-acetyltransferase [Brevibacillus borstelensis]MED1852812.1 N-acetyltransferase [Brevibacillus borstelensis]
MTIRIEQASHDHFTDIIKLWNENCKEVAESELSAEDQESIHDQLVQYTQSRFGVVYVALDSASRLIGYALASLKKDLIEDIFLGQIDEVYVVPEYRRQHTAKALVAEMNDWFQRQEVSAVSVLVDVENTSAQKFWEKIGYGKEFFVMSSDE